MFYAYLVKRMPRRLAQATTTIVYAGLIVLMLMMANSEDAVFRYMN